MAGFGKIEIPKQAEKLVEIAEDKELNNIIEDALNEVQNGETKPLSDLINDLEQEEYKLTKEDAFEIKKYLLDIKDVHIEAKNTLYKNMIEILKETHFIKKSQSANNKTTYGLMFAAGVAFGMSDAKWMPFAKGIYEFFSTVLGKG